MDRNKPLSYSYSAVQLFASIGIIIPLSEFMARDMKETFENCQSEFLQLI